MTRRDICRRTNLSWAAVSKAVAQLSKLGFVGGGPPLSTGVRGRNPEEISLDRGPLLVGAAVEPERISVVLVNLWADRIDSLEIPLEEGDCPIPAVNSALEHIFKKHRKRIISIGVSLPGIIDFSTGRVTKSIHFPELQGRDICGEIRMAAATGIPVAIERNAVCDMLHGTYSGQISEDCILISATYGLSAAFYFDGIILHGGDGNIGEIGHLPVPGSTIPCRCGRTGCLENIAGGYAWQRQWKTMPGSASPTQDSFEEALAAGNPRATDMIHVSMLAIFSPLSALLHVLKPRKLVFCLSVPDAAAGMIARMVKDIIAEEDIPDPPEIEILFRKDAPTASGAAIAGLMSICGNPQHSGGIKK